MGAILTFARSIQRGASLCQEVTNGSGPMQMCWSEVPVPMLLRENYHDVCDPRSTNFIFNNSKDHGFNENECLGLECWFSWIAAGRVAQAMFIMMISVLLPPPFPSSQSGDGGASKAHGLI